MVTKKNPNRLDQVTKLLREQLHEIEREERELRRAKDRVMKALGLFVQENPTGSILRPKQGPVRKDSHIVLQNAIKAAFVPGHVFHFRQAVELGQEQGLREGQAHGAVQTLYNMGVLKRQSKGFYYYGTEEPNGSNGNNS